MAGEFVFPELGDPGAVVGVSIGVDRVEKVAQAVAARVVLVGRDEPWAALLVWSVEGVALGGDGEAGRVDLEFEDAAGDGAAVVGVQRLEAVADPFDLVVGEGEDGVGAVVLVGPPGARDEATVVTGDDAHAVGVGHRPGPACVGDAPL